MRDVNVHVVQGGFLGDVMRPNEIEAVRELWGDGESRVTFSLVPFSGRNKRIPAETPLTYLLSVAEINAFIGAAAYQLNVPVA